jgi:hypothetical protein
MTFSGAKPKLRMTSSKICEPFHKTIMDKFYTISIGNKIYLRVDELKRDPDALPVQFDNEKPNEGERCAGRTPLETFLANPPPTKEKMLDMESKDKFTVPG